MQAKLRVASESFEGAKSDERVYFDAVVAPLAAEAGLPFTYDEARALVEEDSELSDDSLDAVAGGSCIVLGLGERTGACMGEYFGATGCFGIGVSVSSPLRKTEGNHDRAMVAPATLTQQFGAAREPLSLPLSVPIRLPCIRREPRGPIQRGQRLRPAEK